MAAKDENRIHAVRDTFVVRESISKSMRDNRGSNTKPEQKLRKALWAAGFRGYRKNVKTLPGKPDIAFSRVKLAIFLHGCYWHQCPHCTRNRTPKTNAEFWKAKFESNAKRDLRNFDELNQLGWRVKIVWECQLKDLERQVKEIGDMLGA